MIALATAFAPRCEPRGTRRYNARDRQAVRTRATASACSSRPFLARTHFSFMPSVPLFWLVALLLLAATVAALVWPLLRTRAPRAVVPDDDATTDVYRDQKRQLDAELA